MKIAATVRIIGLTGGIASGKSIVSKMLERKGAYLIDADQLAREVVDPGEQAWQEIVDWLGEEILTPERKIDRAALGDIVFRDRSKLDRLNAIVHPQVAARIAYLTEQIAEQDPGAIIVYDIPLLIETGMHDLVDLVLLIYVPASVQLSRLQERDAISREEALRRLEAQMPLENKRELADAIIDNSGSVKETEQQVNLFWSKYMQ